MPRFLLPAASLAAAMLVLFAGAFGDLRSWRRDWPALIARTTDTWAAVDQAPSNARSQPETAPASDHEMSQRQMRDLRARIAEETKELAALHVAADQARRELAALREQRERQRQEVPARTDDARNDRPADARPIAARIASPPAPDRVAESTGDQPSAPIATATSSTAPAPEPVTPDLAGPTNTAATGDDARGTAVSRGQSRALQYVSSARKALAAGHRARARWLVGLARSRMNLPVAAIGQPAGEAGSPAWSRLGHMISLIDHGDQDGALRDIDTMLAEAGVDPPNRAENRYEKVH